MIRSTVIALTLAFATVPAIALPVAKASEAVGQSAQYAVMQAADEREPGPANLEEATEIALKRFGGRAIRAQTVVVDGRNVHEIRIISDDETSVRTVLVDPQTGAIIPPRR